LNIYEKYFDKSFENIIKPETKEINHLLSDDMILICGDFYGIQKFIFERLSTKNAAKVLRAKSAFIQIYTIYLAKYICYKMNISENNILTSNAGKFEILSTNKDISILEEIQKKVDEYFIKNFFGLSGVSICSVECTSSDFRNKDDFKKLRKSISDEIEIKKFKKFDLQNLENFVLSYDEDINNQNLCPVCNIRKGKNNCNICNGFIKLGQILSNDNVDEIINSSDLGIVIDDFDTDIVLNTKIKSYMLREKENAADFETLANNSCKDLETGIKSLAVLKADVDSMGDFIKNTDITENFQNFDIFSKSLDNFFSIYIPKIMREKYPNTYTVFAGGDDLFLVGAWDEILELSRQIHNEFKKFIKNKLSISFGITLVKPSYPVSRFAEVSEELLEEAKKHIDKDNNGKDAIALFGETVKWESYLNTFKVLEEVFKIFKKDDEKTAFLYRLLELVEMAKKVKLKEDGWLEATMWKSKLNYSFTRNIDNGYKKLLDVLNEQMDENPEETKFFLCEYIYKRRD